MEPPKCLCLVLLLLLLQFFGCFGCLHQERNALLILKDLFSGVPKPNTFITWVDDEGSDCCEWERVKCNNTTRQVVLLSLNRVANGGIFHTNMYLNASLFLPFENLRHLDLSENYFSAWRHNEGLERLSRLKKLQALNLHVNEFNSSLFQSLSALTSLISLNIGRSFYPFLTDSELSHGLEQLSKLKKLQVLNLCFNWFNSTLFQSLSALTSLISLDIGHGFHPFLTDSELSHGIESLANLKNLEDLKIPVFNLQNNMLPLFSSQLPLRSLDLSSNQLNESLTEFPLGWTEIRVLDLSYNEFSGKIPKAILSLRKLEALSLRGNNLTGSLSEICELRNLLELDLSQSNFEGSIPPCLSNLTNLRMLCLSDNKFTGNIPPSLTNNWRSLRALDLSLNQLTGNIPPSLLHNLTQLVYISFSKNLLDGNQFLTSLPDCKCQLSVLGLSNCSLHLSTTDLFTSLRKQFNFKLIDLSHNKISGKYPNWLVENNTMLESLFLNNNLFSGHIHFSPLPTQTNVKLRNIDISDNHIHGMLQNDFGNVIPNVERLRLSNNGIKGCIPPSIGNMTALWELDLSNNRLQGFRWGSTNLSYFQSLRIIDVSQNDLSGTLPPWIGNLTRVEDLILGDNHFDGPIPPEICQLSNIGQLDLSKNTLSGSIPPCLNLTGLEYMHLQGNELTGELPRAISNSKDLFMLNLGDNKLSGRIPYWLGLLQNLGVVVLRGNLLDGAIPNKLCQLTNLDILDLSQNHLSGSIPICFTNNKFGVSEEKGFYNRATIGGTIFVQDDTWSVLLELSYEGYSGDFIDGDQEELQFMTKNRYDSYKGSILNFMSGIDLSCNHLTGEIPQEIGALTTLLALNLSHNQLTGSIPRKFSGLKSIESMDLSHNNLNGEIPSELSILTTLSVFIVSYNNLSGRVPEKQQFNTFGETSYAGNPLLCGQLLEKKCDNISEVSAEKQPTSVITVSAEKFGIDPVSLVASCAASYIMTLIALVAVLYINRYWRRIWFDFVDRFLIFVFPSWTETIYKSYWRR